MIIPSYFYKIYMTLSLKLFVNFLLNLHIPPWTGKSLRFVVFGLPENAFGSQKWESSHFFSSQKITAHFYNQQLFFDEPNFYRKVLYPFCPIVDILILPL